MWRLQEARDELEEFQEGSRELEAELETQLEQAESRQRELLAAKVRLEAENESLKVSALRRSWVYGKMVARLLFHVTELIIQDFCSTAVYLIWDLFLSALLACWLKKFCFSSVRNDSTLAKTKLTSQYRVYKTS